MGFIEKLTSNLTSKINAAKGVIEAITGANATKKTNTETKPNANTTSYINSYGTSGNSGGGAPYWANQKDWEQATETFTSGDPIVEEAAKQIADLKAKLDNPSYKAQLESVANEINGRKDFSYDFSTDPMFQQMLASYSQMGKMASQDAMAQAAGLTGGYASSFAQSVGNQAYNQMLQEGYNNLPSYYQMALDAYTREGEALKDKYSIFRDLDQTEYDRIMNDISLVASERDSAWAKELEKYGISTGLGQYKLGLQQSDAQHKESLARQAESDRLSMLASGYVQDASGNWIKDPEIEDAETLARLVSQIEKAKANGNLTNFIASLDAEVQESGLLDAALQEAGLTRDSYGRLPSTNDSELLDELSRYGINVKNVSEGTEDFLAFRNQHALASNYNTIKRIYDSYKQRTGKNNEKIEKLLKKYESLQ